MPASNYKNKRKRKVTKFTLYEISAVGKPAQEPALIALSKSAAAEYQKALANKPASEQPEGDPVSDDLKKQIEDLQKKLDEQKASNDTLVAQQQETITRLNKEAAMSPDVRKYYDGLSDTDKGLFLAKSATVQEAEVQNAQLANAVIYKDANGIEYRKSDDPRLIQMAKDADEQRAVLKKLEDQNSDLALQKQLDEFKHLPGDEASRRALLKSVNAIEDEEERKNALATLKSHDANLSKFFQVTGTTANGDGQEPTATTFVKSGSTKLDELVKAHMKDNPGTPVEKAFDAVLQTPEGEAAYSEVEYAS